MIHKINIFNNPFNKFIKKFQYLKFEILLNLLNNEISNFIKFCKTHSKFSVLVKKNLRIIYHSFKRRDQ